MIGLTLALQWAYGMSNSIMAFCTALYLSNYCMASGISLDSMVSLWSLAVEEHFYILFPLLLIVSARYGMRAVYICLLCVFCAALGARIGYALADKPVNYIHWRTESVMDLIIAGCAIAGMSSHDAGRMVLRAMATTTIFLLTSAVYVLALVSMAPSDKLHLAFDQSVLSIWLAVLLINTLCNPDFALLRRILNHPAAVWIGGISYSVYVWHCFVMFFQYRYELIAGPFSIAAAVAITLLLGAASSRFIERPIAARRKIWSERLGIRPRPMAALQG
jgi:peptidoglycan/LPS O-acetylase OafA/YrhL